MDFSEGRPSGAAAAVADVPLTVLAIDASCDADDLEKLRDALLEVCTLRRFVGGVQLMRARLLVILRRKGEKEREARGQEGRQEGALKVGRKRGNQGETGWIRGGRRYSLRQGEEGPRIEKKRGEEGMQGRKGGKERGNGERLSLGYIHCSMLSL